MSFADPPKPASAPVIEMCPAPSAAITSRQAEQIILLLRLLSAKLDRLLAGAAP